MYKRIAIWYELAREFNKYITKRNTFVSEITSPDSTELWAAIKSFEQRENCTVGIVDSIIFTNDAILCTNYHIGYSRIDLKCPYAYEELLNWMKRCELVPSETILKHPLI